MTTDGGPFAAEREYVTIRPTTEPLVATHVADALRGLHHTNAGSQNDRPLVEMLLATAGDDAGVSYRFGTENLAVDRLERQLRRCLPNEYELTRTNASVQDCLTGSRDTADGSGVDSRSVAAAELQATEDRAGDWKTRLRALETFTEGDRARWPLAAVVDGLEAATVPVLVQTLLAPKPDWAAEANETIEKYHYPPDSIADRLVGELLGVDDGSGRQRRSRGELPSETARRIEEIQAVNARSSFEVNVRAAAFGPTPSASAASLEDLLEGLTAIGQTTYQLRTTTYGPDSREAVSLADAIATRSLRGFSLGRRLADSLHTTIPFRTETHPVIVADPSSVGGFCFVGGANLPEPTMRALQTRPGERTGQPRPPKAVLDRYRCAGYALGRPQTGDRDPTPEPISLPPSLHRRHMLIAGQTGSGKTVLGEIGLLANHAATDGATVLIESKDGQMADEYVRAHYAKYGTLENVYRFDAAEHAPATPFFDVTRQQASGIPRSQAVEDVSDHTQELLRAIMADGHYDQAIDSPAVVEALVKALFDPVHGSDQFALDELQDRLRRFADAGHAPPVIDTALRRELQRFTDNTDDTFTEIVAGAARRVAKAALDSRVAPLFNFAPQRDGTAGIDPFDWRTKLDEDCVIVIDTSDLRQGPQQVVTLVILSQLWTALRRRDRDRSRAGTRGTPPHVTLHIEEAADIASSGVLDDMLRKGRSFGLGVTLSLQFPGQLEHADEATYQEALNNIGTVVTGRVDSDRALAERLATDDMPPADVANRLRGLAPGEWLVSLPAEYGAAPPRPFQIESLSLPPGHPDGPQPLSDAQQATFAAAQAQMHERSRRHSIAITRPQTDVTSHDTTTDDPDLHAQPGGGADIDHLTIETTLPFTDRLPSGVQYHAPSSSLVCSTCETRYGRRLADLKAAAGCHGDLSAVDPADVPTVYAGLTLSPGERLAKDYSDEQLVFLQLVYNAHQQRYDTDWEYDIVHDGMEALRAYAGLDDTAFEDLVVDGLLRIDDDYPHTLYTVTPERRALIDAAHREGRAYGDGVGDLSELSMHVMMVESICRGLESTLVADPEHPGETVEAYYPIEEGRLDVAVLDEDGDVVVTAEAERSNNDTLRAVPADYDKMAACDPDQAIWVVEGRSEGHEIIEALHNPADGDARVGKTYTESYALTRVTIDEPGFTDIYTIGSFRNRYLED